MPEVKTTYIDDYGIKRTLIQDTETPDLVTQQVQQDVTQIVERNAILAEEHARRSDNKLLARVPISVYEQSIREKWDDNDWKKFLNDPDNAMFRVWKGQV